MFGKVVGGIDTLSEIERIEVDNQDRPIEDIVLQRAQIFVDPFQEADEQVSCSKHGVFQNLFLILVEERKRR